MQPGAIVATLHPNDEKIGLFRFTEVNVAARTAKVVSLIDGDVDDLTLMLANTGRFLYSVRERW